MTEIDEINEFFSGHLQRYVTEYRETEFDGIIDGFGGG
jgi:hypothetical protein